MAKGKKQNLSAKELFEQALVPEDEQPYEVPGNWIWTKLGEIIKVSSGKSLTASKMNSDGIVPVYGGNGVTGYHSDSNVPPSTIVIGRVGYYCGSVHFIHEDAWVTDNALIVSYNDECIDTQFLFWLLRNTNLRVNDSSTAQPVISGAKIYDLPVVLPPYAEQKRIVGLIESLYAKLDQAKELTKNALDRFETRRAAILHKAFTGELTAKWREEHGLRMDSWEKRNIGDFAFVTKLAGFEYTKNIAPNLTETGIPLFKGKNIQSGELVFEFESYIPKSVSDELPRSKLLKKCLLTPYVGTIGNIAVFDGSFEAHLGSNVGKIEIQDSSITEEYLLYFLRSDLGYAELTKQKKATAQESISIQAIREVSVNVPQLSEQQEIVRIMDNLTDKEQQAKELCDDVIDKIDMIKKVILARAFRGKLGTNDPSEESPKELLII